VVTLKEPPNALGVSRHRPERPSSASTPNSGMIGGRLHAVLGGDLGVKAEYIQDFNFLIKGL